MNLSTLFALGIFTVFVTAVAWPPHPDMWRPSLVPFKRYIAYCGIALAAINLISGYYTGIIGCLILWVVARGSLNLYVRYTHLRDMHDSGAPKRWSDDVEPD